MPLMIERTEEGGFKTPCKECIFFNNSVCHFCRIDKFRNNGIKVEEDKVFTFCNYARSIEWQTENDLTFEKAVKQTVTDNYITFDLVVHVPRLDSLESLEQTLDSAFGKIKPSSVHIILDKTVKMSDVIPIGKQVYNTYSVKVLFTVILQSLDVSINSIFPKLKANYYALINVGKQFKPTTFSDLESLINDECKKVSLLKSEDFVIINRMVHEALKGNSGMNLVEKIELVEQENKTKTIHNV